MGTVVTIQVVARDPDRSSSIDDDAAIDGAFRWFDEIEARCSRFDPDSELMRLTAEAGRVVPVSPLMFEAVRFAIAVAEDTGGAFDPTVGRTMETLGFNREHRRGRIIRTDLATDDAVSYRDVCLDSTHQTITLRRPLILDLGAVAKGLAIDMAARELAPLRDFAIDAGGDLYFSGCNPDGAPWSAGIRHPRRDDELIDRIVVSNRAVCTSGDYERVASGDDGGHHILDPRTGLSAGGIASATVVAPTAMLADALATATFVLGPREGLDLLTRVGVDGLIVSSDLERFETAGWPRA
jgi:thiamine biosynthesis lipoprotein